MTRDKWRLTVRSEFAAAHSLRNYNGKCEALHGHNFAVEATVEGRKLTSDTELLVDFSVVKQALRAVLAQLDHGVLNDLPPFDIRNPSSENLAQYIYMRMKPLMAEHNVAVYSVTVSEKSAQSATYMETDA